MSYHRTKYLEEAGDIVLHLKYRAKDWFVDEEELMETARKMVDRIVKDSTMPGVFREVIAEFLTMGFHWCEKYQTLKEEAHG